MKSLTRLFFIIAAIIFISGCQPKSGSKKEKSSTKRIKSDSIELTNGWARPASKGGNSAAYLQLFNGTNNADTLLAVQSDVAAKAAVHESFEENGMAGMRPATALALPSDSSLQLKPGDFHIMLMNLNSDLTEGDSLAIIVEFAQAGSKQLSLPVKLSN